MDNIFISRFPHIVEKILENLDVQSLRNGRQVSKSWQKSIDEKNLLWIQVIKTTKILKNGMTPIHWAFWKGDLKIGRFLVQNSAKLNIDLNERDDSRRTIFHLACWNGDSKIAEILLKKSVELKIDVNATTKKGKTAFHLACQHASLKIVNILMENSADYSINLNAKDKYGWTAFHLACYWGRSRIVKSIIEKSDFCNISLTIKTDQGHDGRDSKTTLHLATICDHGNRKETIKLIKTKFPNMTK